MFSDTTLPRPYHPLRNYLQQQNWRESDRETRRLMLASVGKPESSYWENSDYDNCPCQDLETLDRLWRHYSQNRFGFSIQKQIYESLGDIPTGINSRFAERLGDRLGWRSDNDWLYYRDLRFSLNAPPGHLPWLGIGKQKRHQNKVWWDELLEQTLAGVDSFLGLEEKGELLIGGGLYWMVFYQRTLLRCNIGEESGR
jgi:hypothetical protein